MKKSMAHRVLQFVRRAEEPVTTKQVCDEFKIEQKVASSCLSDLRSRNQLKITGTRAAHATGRPANLWSVA